MPTSRQAEPLREIVTGCVERAGEDLNALQSEIIKAKSLNANWAKRFDPYVAQYVVIQLKDGQTMPFENAVVDGLGASSVFVFNGYNMSQYYDVKYSLIEDFY